ncbi:MAG: leucine-rich repeat domain-containing protein [bacterium]
MIKHTKIALLLGVLLLGAGCTNSSNVFSSNYQPDPNGDPFNPPIRADLHSSDLTHFPSSLFDNTKIEWLDLSDNNITGSFPSEIREFKNLKYLNASHNKMTGVPAEIGQLSALEELDLSYNKLTGLPLELGNLKNLKRLDLRGNEISPQDLDSIRTKLTKTEILST